MSNAVPQPAQPGVSALVAVFHHHTWANLKLLDYCAGLSDEQLDATTAGTFGSIRDTLLHLVNSEVSYAGRAQGRAPIPPPPADQFPGFAALKDAARMAGEELLQLALSTQPHDMVRQRPPRLSIQYKLADLMAQAVSHACEHRTQVSAIITILGLEPPDLSGWNWMEERGELEEIKDQA